MSSLTRRMRDGRAPAVDVGVELRSERAALVLADRHLRDGEGRVRKQEGIGADLQTAGHDVREAERLLNLLRQILAQWRHHRTLMLQRIAYLEARSGERAGSEAAG